MVEDTAAPLLVTREEFVEVLPETEARILLWETEATAIAGRPTTRPDRAAAADQLAYVVYTSGSVGKPKGVMVTHAAFVASYLAWEVEYGLRQWPGTHLQMASPSFDVFAGDWVRALCSGGKLVLCPWGTLLEPEELYALMGRAGVDCAEFVPAVVRLLMGHLRDTGQRLEFMRMMAVGSDVWSVLEYEQVKSLCGEATRLVNSYGVAEAAVDSTYFERTALELQPERGVPIGRAFGGNFIYLLDDGLRPVPCGVAAELYLGGDTLARGYLARPMLSAERFLPDALSGRSGSRIYRTGDLARALSDGQIELLGRVDHQVKIRGFRIELGEIEAELEGHPEVRDAAVVVREDQPGDKRLVAYIVPEPDCELAVDDLRCHLRERLPGYMVPAAVLLLEAMPLTPNGKVDHRALPVPDPGQLHAADEYVAPETPTEQELAEIWGELLEIERVGIYDNFFDLGGHSLLATQLISRIRTRFQVELTLATFFGGPTVADVAKSVDVARRVIADAQRDRTAAEDEEREEGAL